MKSNNFDSGASASGSSKLWNTAIDLAKCDQEQVRFPGAIMPHGLLLVLDPGDYRILGVSENSRVWLNHEVEQLMGRRLDSIFEPNAQLKIEQALLLIINSFAPAYLGGFEVLDNQFFDVFAHRSGNFFVLELEAVTKQVANQFSQDALHELAASVSKLQQATHFQQAVFTAVQELKRLTGFDSVIGVRFLDDGSGQAIAEACEADFPSFFDKRFPPSDVPEPARKQLLMIKQQYAPDMDYEPVAISMVEPENQPQQLDLGFAVLRSLSPLCSRYYLNMGARSRLLLPLVVGGQLWGFFACLNAKVRPLCYATRFACQTFAGVALQVLVEMEKSEHNRKAFLLNQCIGELCSGLVTTESFPTVVEKLPARLLDMLDLSGVAFYLDGQISSVGLVPSETMLETMIPKLDCQGRLLASDHFPNLFGLDISYANQTAGLLALRLQKTGQYLLGFRLEWVHDVYWAGDPAKPVEVDASGERRLTPRGSFEAWKEWVHGVAQPWKAYEIEAMTELQNSLILLQQTEKEQALSKALEQAYAELEALRLAIHKTEI